MKKLILFSAMWLTIVYAHATIITVDNNLNSSANYTNLQTAINEASIGDTIYVSGSLQSYGEITISKKLHLLGAGYNPNNQFSMKSILGSITFDFIAFPTSDPSGSTIEGFEISSISISDSHGKITDIHIRRNRIGSITMSNTSDNIIENNIITSYLWGSAFNGSQPHVTNLIVRNNIFINAHPSLYYFVSSSVLISNNVFLSTTSTGSASSYNERVIFSNNIFYGAGVGSTNDFCKFCTFTNNISFGPSSTDFDYGTNTTGGNIEATDPLFNDAANFSFEYTDDYRLKSNSPAKNAGSDGTDIGITGGTSPWPVTEASSPYIHSSFPAVPQITQMDIQNASVGIGGTINVNIKAKVVN